MTESVRTDGVPNEANGALSSWRDGPAKRAILDFVAAASGQDGSEPVAPEERRRRAGARTGRPRRLDDRQRPRRLGHGLLTE
jgi:hypothetical protein